MASFLEEIDTQEIPAAPHEEKGGVLGAVRLLTAHRSKGLEWDLVIVAGPAKTGATWNSAGTCALAKKWAGEVIAQP